MKLDQGKVSLLQDGDATRRNRPRPLTCLHVSLYLSEKNWGTSNVLNFDSKLADLYIHFMKQLIQEIIWLWESNLASRNRHRSTLFGNLSWNVLILTHSSYFPSSSSASGWSRWSGTSVTFCWRRCWDSCPCCVWEYPPAPPCPPSSSPSPCGWPARSSWATSTTTVSVWASPTARNRPSRHIGRLTDRTESSAKKFIPVSDCGVAFYC